MLFFFLSKELYYVRHSFDRIVSSSMEMYSNFCILADLCAYFKEISTSAGRESLVSRNVRMYLYFKIQLSWCLA